MRGIEITNLRAFRTQLRRAEDATPRELSAAIRKAGAPVVERAAQLAPRRTGDLSKSYRIRTSGTTGQIYSSVPYGPGAEWGLHGKWRGFRRYPAFGTGAATGRGRFAWRAVVERQEEIAQTIADELREIVELHGWARP